MIKHTPGPWSYHEWGAKGSGLQFGIETADHKHGIAGIQPNGNASTGLTMEEHRSNAMLIAAAPNLLFALQEVARLYQFRGVYGDMVNGLIKEAIAKAHGDDHIDHPMYQ